MQSSLSMLNRFTRQCLSVSRTALVNNNSINSFANNASGMQLRSYCNHKKKHHHHGQGTSEAELEQLEDAASFPIQMRRADLLKKMDAREQEETKEFEQEEELGEDDQFDDFDEDGEGSFNANEVQEKMQLRRKKLAIEDELESISRFGSGTENKYHPDVLSTDQLERAVFGEDGKIIPPENVTSRDMYLHLMRKYRGLKTKTTKEFDFDENSLIGHEEDDQHHDDEHTHNLSQLSSERKQALLNKRLEMLEKQRIHEEMLEKAEEVGAENIEKYKVNPRLEKLRAQKQAKLIEDKSSTEYLMRHISKLQQQGAFDEPVTRSPTTGKEVIGNKKFPKCLLCFDYGWKVEPLNIPLLSIYLNNDGDILPRYITGNCLKHQKKIAKTIKQAKHLGLYSYKKGTFTIYDPNVVPPTPKEDAEYDKWFRGDFTDKDWIGDESIEEVDDLESPIDQEKEKLKQKESIMLDMGVSEHEADSILAGKFFKIKDNESK